MKHIESTIAHVNPRIYVASLADYNAGRLLGEWVDAAQTGDAIRGAIVEILARSPEPVAEEWAIHDYEGFGTLILGEVEDIDAVAKLAVRISEHGTIFAELVAHLGDLHNLDEAERYIEDGYRGEYDSIRDYVEQLIDECYAGELVNLPAFIRYHIDYEGIARDMEINGDFFTVQDGGRLHVFEGNL